jgi:phosphohistidine swiveling domain-containing protein
MSFQVFGIPVSRGVAIGRAVLVASSRIDVAHYFVPQAQVEQEVRRMVHARDAAVSQLESLKDDITDDAPHELGALVDVHLLLLKDEDFSAAVAQWIRERHYNAEWALSAQLEVLARQFDEMEDDYLRERKADVEQVVGRVLSVLAGEVSAADAVAQRDFAGEDPLLLVAADISPADLIQFKRSVFCGFITDIGGKTSHTAIVARSMDIPAVVGTREASRLILQDDWVIVDGDAGAVIVNPSPIVLEEYRFRQRQSELERARLARLRFTPAVTLDGQKVELHANIEQPSDAAAAIDAGAVGVGLFRSEFLFMNRQGDLPSEDEQFEAYKATRSGDLPAVPFEMLTALDLDTRGWAEIARKARWQWTRMNLNTLARHGVFADPEMVDLVAARLASPTDIREARAFPYQLLAAYLNADAGVPVKVKNALQDAVEVAIENVPKVDGKVVVMVDMSGSMKSPITGSRAGATSKVTCVDVAALVASAFLRVNPEAEVIPFADRVKPLTLNPRDSVVTNTRLVAATLGGGTNCAAPLSHLNSQKAKADLLVMVSDNQSWLGQGGSYGTAATPMMAEWMGFRTRNPKARLACIDLQPYTTSQVPERPEVLNIGGFGDSVFDLIDMFAKGEMEKGHWVAEIEKVEV